MKSLQSRHEVHDESLGWRKLVQLKVSCCEQSGFCEFVLPDWNVLGIDLMPIRLLIDRPNEEDVDSSCDARRLSRVVVAGQIIDNEVLFYRSVECPIQHPLIIRDYCDSLSSSAEIRSIISIAQHIGSTTLLKYESLRFCVELFCRRSAMATDLLPHQDGKSLLLFVVLYSTVIGGEMHLFRCQNIADVPALYRDQRGTDFYDSGSMERVRTIPCQSGNGYIVIEDDVLSGGRILHGCNSWSMSPYGVGKRVYMRISITGA